MKKSELSPCKIHNGELDLTTLMPIDRKGNYILYGYRLCGNRECVNPEHHTTNIRVVRNMGQRPEALFYKRKDIDPAEIGKYSKRLEFGSNWEGKSCGVPHCQNLIRTLNLCNAHHTKYIRWRANQVGYKRKNIIDFTDVLQAVQPAINSNKIKVKDRYCHVEGCTNEYRGRGLCSKHLSRWERATKK